MENIQEFETESFGIVEKHILIDRGNGEYTSMLKSTYDEMLNAPTTSLHQPLVEG
jgi:hypothetical protein